MKKKLVSLSVDLTTPPPMSPVQRERLRSLRRRSDDDIDPGDIPTLTEEFWQHAVRNPLYRPTKTSTTIRLDADVLTWLRTQGRGYQTRINAILRREMLADVAKLRGS